RLAVTRTRHRNVLSGPAHPDTRVRNRARAAGYLRAVAAGCARGAPAGARAPAGLASAAAVDEAPAFLLGSPPIVRSTTGTIPRPRRSCPESFHAESTFAPARGASGDVLARGTGARGIRASDPRANERRGHRRIRVPRDPGRRARL